MWTFILIYITAWFVSWAVIYTVGNRKYGITFNTIKYTINAMQFMQGEISIFAYLKFVLFTHDFKTVVAKIYAKNKLLGIFNAIVRVVFMPVDFISWISAVPVLFILRHAYLKSMKLA